MMNDFWPMLSMTSNGYLASTPNDQRDVMSVYMRASLFTSTNQRPTIIIMQ